MCCLMSGRLTLYSNCYRWRVMYSSTSYRSFDPSKSKEAYDSLMKVVVGAIMGLKLYTFAKAVVSRSASLGKREEGWFGQAKPA